jgi:hypothetical protein
MKTANFTKGSCSNGLSITSLCCVLSKSQYFDENPLNSVMFNDICMKEVCGTIISTVNTLSYFTIIY